MAAIKNKTINVRKNMKELEILCILCRGLNGLAVKENCRTISQNVEVGFPYYLQFTQTNWRQGPQYVLNRYVHSSFINNSYNLKAIQQMYSWTKHVHKMYSSASKKEGNSDTFDNMDVP